MSDLRTSRHRELLEAARADGPNSEAKTKMWSAVRDTANVAGGAGAAASAASALSKMLSLGTLLGGTVTVGLAATLLYVGHAHVETSRTPAAPLGATLSTKALRSAGQESSSVESSRDNALQLEAWREGPLAVAAERSAFRDRSPLTAPVHVTPRHSADTLAREAGLVNSARACLTRRDGSAALKALRRAISLPERQLQPEELSMLVQALRLLDRQDDADAVERKLKSLYPLSELVRSR